MADSTKFKEAMAVLGESYDKPFSEPKLKIYWQSLKSYSDEQIQHAVSKYISQENCQFFPKPGELISLIEGGKPTTDEIISSARLANSPMGILARIQIGTWDLNNQTDMFYLRQRAEECLQLMPDWKARAMRGEYTDHEISIMLKHNISPVAPFVAGIAPPSRTQELLARARSVKASKRHLLMIDPPYDGDNDHIKPSKDVAKVYQKIINE